MDFDAAINAHLDWKIKFRVAIAKKATLEQANIAADNCCLLGKWLHGEGGQKLGSLNGYAYCVMRHAEFHKHAGKVAQAINEQKYDEAHDMLKPGSPYETASLAVCEALEALKRELGLRLRG